MSAVSWLTQPVPPRKRWLVLLSSVLSGLAAYGRIARIQDIEKRLDRLEHIEVRRTP